MVHIFLYIAAIPFNKQPLSTVPRQDPPDRPGWISKIQTSGREVLVHLQLTSSERQQLQLSTGGGASSACRARLERLDTGEVWMLPLSAGCSSAKWTRDGLKLTLEDMDDMDESMSRWSVHHGKSANPRRRVKLSIAPRASWSCWRCQSRIRPDMTRWS